MSTRFKAALFVLLSMGVVFLLVLMQNRSGLDVLNTKGLIGDQQRNLLIGTALLSLVVIVPVFAMTIFIAWKYRASNVKAKYSPEWDHHKVIEFIWWAIPCAIIFVLAVITWVTTHALDPYKPLVSSVKPITIQVVSLEWKWLFIYPEQRIASVNFVQFPEDTPVNFEITSDAPMNSFWIPKLGGQVYAMNGMVTKLHLMASGSGSYNGVSANISGEGFAGMRFIAKSSSKQSFNAWVDGIRSTSTELHREEYEKLAQPSRDVAPAYYLASDRQLFQYVTMKYMSPESEAVKESTADSHGDEHESH